MSDKELDGFLILKDAAPEAFKKIMSNKLTKRDFDKSLELRGKVKK